MAAPVRLQSSRCRNAAWFEYPIKFSVFGNDSGPVRSFVAAAPSAKLQQSGAVLYFAVDFHFLLSRPSAPRLSRPSIKILALDLFVFVRCQFAVREKKKARMGGHAALLLVAR